MASTLPKPEEFKSKADYDDALQKYVIPVDTPPPQLPHDALKNDEAYKKLWAHFFPAEAIGLLKPDLKTSGANIETLLEIAKLHDAKTLKYDIQETTYDNHPQLQIIFHGCFDADEKNPDRITSRVLRYDIVASKAGQNKQFVSLGEFAYVPYSSVASSPSPSLALFRAFEKEPYATWRISITVENYFTLMRAVTGLRLPPDNYSIEPDAIHQKLKASVDDGLAECVERKDDHSDKFRFLSSAAKTFAITTNILRLSDASVRSHLIKAMSEAEAKLKKQRRTHSSEYRDIVNGLQCVRGIEVEAQIEKVRQQNRYWSEEERKRHESLIAKLVFCLNREISPYVKYRFDPRGFGDSLDRAITIACTRTSESHLKTVYAKVLEIEQLRAKEDTVETRVTLALEYIKLAELSGNEKEAQDHYRYAERLLSDALIRIDNATATEAAVLKKTEEAKKIEAKERKESKEEKESLIVRYRNLKFEILQGLVRTAANSGDLASYYLRCIFAYNYITRYAGDPMPLEWKNVAYGLEQGILNRYRDYVSMLNWWEKGYNSLQPEAAEKQNKRQIAETAMIVGSMSLLQATAARIINRRKDLAFILESKEAVYGYNIDEMFPPEIYRTTPKTCASRSQDFLAKVLRLQQEIGVQIALPIPPPILLNLLIDFAHGCNAVIDADLIFAVCENAHRIAVTYNLLDRIKDLDTIIEHQVQQKEELIVRAKRSVARYSAGRSKGNFVVLDEEFKIAVIYLEIAQWKKLTREVETAEKYKKSAQTMLEHVLKEIDDAAEPISVGANQVGRMLTLTDPFRDLQMRVHERLGDVYAVDDNREDALREYHAVISKLPPDNRRSKNDSATEARLNNKLTELQQHRKELAIKI